MATGGYGLHFVDTVDEDLKCAICLFVCKHPQQLTCCGKLLCYSCLTGWKKNNPECPHCRRIMKYFPEVKTDHMIKQLRVKCEDHNCTSWPIRRPQSRKCKGASLNSDVNVWIGTLQDHEAMCNFVFKECPNGCGEMLMRYKLSQHVNRECSKRTYRCPLCGKLGPHDEIRYKHLFNECPELYVACQNHGQGCGVTVLRCKIEEHMVICPYQIVCCKYEKNIGCTFQTVWKNSEIMQNHEDDSQLHLTLALDTITKLRDRQ